MRLDNTIEKYIYLADENNKFSNKVSEIVLKIATIKTKLELIESSKGVVNLVFGS